MAELIPLTFIVMYIVPFCIAAARAHDAAVPIFVVNVLFGWTIIGWLAAFAWAALGPAETPGSRARSARRYEKNMPSGKTPMPRILHNFTD
ncbi:MAG: superinfection immunity protein [Myxococcota bacterium]|jgi:hypothetical protein|nr:superinfection immunity protein [Myxococcota bacterium]